MQVVGTKVEAFTSHYGSYEVENHGSSEHLTAAQCLYRAFMSSGGQNMNSHQGSYQTSVTSQQSSYQSMNAHQQDAYQSMSAQQDPYQSMKYSADHLTKRPCSAEHLPWHECSAEPLLKYEGTAKPLLHDCPARCPQILMLHKVPPTTVLSKSLTNTEHRLWFAHFVSGFVI